MKIDITHNNEQELMMQAINDQGLCTTLQRSMEEYDIALILMKLQQRFDYTGAQMTAFCEEWKLMYADWYHENFPLS